MKLNHLFNLFTAVFISVSSPAWAHSAMEAFSEIAWRDIAPVYKSIVKHPFNQELKNGTLPRRKFDFYQAQDQLYLIDFAKSLAILAAEMDDPNDIEVLLQFAKDCLQEDQSANVRKLPRPSSVAKSPATILYTEFLLHTARFGSREELAAALLPCFWIYQKVAEDLKRDAHHPNSYDRWLTSYTSSSYKNTVELMIGIVNRLAAATSNSQRQRMHLAFNTATTMEWLFWDSAYRSEERSENL